MQIQLFDGAISVDTASVTGPRLENEDSIGWIAISANSIVGETADRHPISKSSSIGKRMAFFIVCDGMGGLNNGKEMSRSVVDRSIDWVGKSLFEKAEDVFIGYRNYLSDLEKDLMSKYPKSGTTIAVAFYYDDEWYSMHLGDSRCYWITKGTITRTKDHSPVEEMYRAGIIDESEMHTHPMKNVISAFFGGGYSTKLEFDKLGKPDHTILCSDGLFGHLEPHDFASILSRNLSASQMVEEALITGSRDNVSIIDIKVL